MRGNVLGILILFFCLDFAGVKAQHNEYKIDDGLFRYMMQAQNNLRRKNIGLLQLDTLYTKALQKKDLKAQCLALYLRVVYYHSLGEYEKERLEFKRISPIILNTPYQQYYFGAWRVIITEDFNRGNKTEAFCGLDKYKERALALKNDYGMMTSYELLGDYYMGSRYFQLALSQYYEALDYALKKQIGDLVGIYSHIGQCCMWLRRWDAREKALLTSLSMVNDEMKMIYPNSVLLSLYCRSDEKDSVKIQKTYEKLQYLVDKHPLIGSNESFYIACMHDYCRYYLHDEKMANAYAAEITTEQDSLTYYNVKAKEAELNKDYRKSSYYYKKYGDFVDTWRLRNEHFILSSFVPQMEYQEVDDENNKQLRHQAKMRLQELKDNELLISLADERDKAKIARKLKERELLKNDLEIQRLTWTRRDKQLQQIRLKAEQRRKYLASQEKKEYWRILFFSSFIALILILTAGYAVNQYLLRKRLRRVKERAKESDRIKSLFFQNMNHEIRNPLNAIIGFNELLNSKISKTLTEKEKNDFVAMIDTNSNLLMKLVNDVLDLSNIESGVYQLSLVDVDIYQLCHTTLESVRGHEHEGVTLSLYTTSEGPFMLHTDAQRLQQVLTNFLTNACKHTEKGSITLSYEVLPQMVRFAVSDTGSGIKDEDADKVFERFKMLDATKRGTGLGLHICRLISNLLHGKVYVDTSYTKGARFVFDHPIKNLLLSLIVMCCSFLPGKAQNNTLHIAPHLYQYYLLMDKQINLPQGGAMADTLFRMAQKSGDVEAQCLALMNKAKHYRYAYGNTERPLLQSFAHCKSFCLAHKHYKYMFKGWGYVINYYLYRGRFKEAMTQLQQYQHLMRKLNDPYGISMYFYEVGNFYTVQHQNATALSYYQKALHYWIGERRSIYALIGQSYYYLQDYQNAICYSRKALEYCTTDINRINPVIYLAKSYCMRGDEFNATLMVDELKRLQHLYMNRVSFANFYGTLYLYYQYIKKDHKTAMEALLAAGNGRSPEYIGAYYASLGEYKASNKYYKAYAGLSTKWLHTDLGSLFNSYISRFDFDRAIKERDRLGLANLQMQLRMASRRKQLLLMQRDKSRWMLKRTDMVNKQKSGTLLLQNLLLEQQQVDIAKQRVLTEGTENQRMIDGQCDDWRCVAICFVLLSVLTASISTFYHLHRKTKRLRSETIVAEAIERAKNRFYQRVNDRIHEPLHTIVSLNKQLNGSEALNFSEIEKSDMMRRLNKNSQLLNRIVNDVLDISKLESGTYKLDLSDVSVDELCQSAMKGVADKLDRNVRLRFCPQPSDAITPLVIRTDESRLLYILSVYLSNACRHTTVGSITLAYELLPHSIRFSVTDTGRMLYSEEAAMIFSRYLTDNRDHSLGLGLYAVRLSANLLHGKAYADTSGAISGARFYLDLPIEYDKL